MGQSHFAKGPYAPSSEIATVSPDDNTDLPKPARSLYIGVAGDVELIPLEGSTAVVFKNVPAGTVLPVMAKRIRATSTTATDIVALF